MCEELHAMKERLLENWLELMANDTECQATVYRVFGEPLDFYRHCKECWIDEDLENDAFLALTDWDCEGMFYNPREVLMRYTEGK